MTRTFFSVLATFGLLIALTLTANAKTPLRNLTTVQVESGERMVDIQLAIDGNNNQPLGKVYYSGNVIKIILQHTALEGKKSQKIKTDDSLVSRIDLNPGKGYVVMYIRLTQKVTSLMEHISFEPSLDGNTITLRKAAYYAPPTPADSAADAKAAAEVEPLLEALQATAQKPGDTTKTEAALAGEAPPLVAPVELAEPAAPQPSSDPQTPGDVVAHREQTLTQLLDPTADSAAAGVASPTEHAQAPESKTEQPQAISGVGTATPDLSNLYVMAGVILLVAALWFGLVRRRHVRLGGRDEPLRVVKTQSLGNKQRLVVVEAEGKRLLLSVTDKDVRLLSELDAGGDDRDIASALQSEKVRFLHTAATTEAVDPPASKAVGGATHTRAERPAFFGSGASGNPFSHASGKESGLKEKMRTLRKKG
jgi:flagellar biogenesis protein FliO